MILSCYTQERENKTINNSLKTERYNAGDDHPGIINENFPTITEVDDRDHGQTRDTSDHVAAHLVTTRAKKDRHITVEVRHGRTPESHVSRTNKEINFL